MLKKTIKWCTWTFVSFVLIYGVWVVVAMNRTATISVDYIAKLNEVASAVPEEERAWPLYREASIALNANEMPSDIFYDTDLEVPSWPTEDGWEYFKTWLQAHTNTLALVHEGANKSGCGFVTQGRVQVEDRELWPDEYASQGDEEHDGFVMSVMFPQLIHMRSMARLLAYDAKAAAYNGDAGRCLADLESMLRIGTHLREHPLLISDLVCFSIYRHTFHTIADIMEQVPTLFSQTQFAQLEQNLIQLDDSLVLRLDGERYLMYDLLQRVYTDNGNGDGNIIPLLPDSILQLTDAIGKPSSASLTPALFVPLMDVFASSRKELRNEYDRRMDLAEQHSGVRLYELKEMQNPFGDQLYSAPRYAIDPYFLIDLLMPALDKAIMQGEYVRATRDATIAVLYAVQVHNDTGEWPVDLASAGVVDAWSGTPLLITMNNGSPLIYSVGFDQQDDGGEHSKDAQRWSSWSKGDWVLWPSPE